MSAFILHIFTTFLILLFATFTAVHSFHRKVLIKQGILNDQDSRQQQHDLLSNWGEQETTDYNHALQHTFLKYLTDGTVSKSSNVTNSNFVAHEENMSTANLEVNGDKNNTAIHTENVTISNLESYDRINFTLAQKENVTHSTSESLDSNYVAAASEEKLAKSTSESYNSNHISFADKKNMTNSISESYDSNHVTSQQKENVTNSASESFDSNYVTSQQKENVTNSASESFDKNLFSVFSREKISDLQDVPSYENSNNSLDDQHSNISSSNSLDDQHSNISSSNSLDDQHSNISSSNSLDDQHSNISSSNSLDDQHSNISSSNSLDDQHSNISSSNSLDDQHSNISSSNSLDDQHSNISSSNTNVVISNTTEFPESSIDFSDNNSELTPESLTLTEKDASLNTDSSVEHSESENSKIVPDPATEIGCPTCRVRAIDRHYRILQFKNHILNTLHITSLPNTTGVTIPKVPALTHLYDSEVDLISDSTKGHGRGRYYQDAEMDEDFIIKTERIFISAKESPLGAYLNLTDTLYFPPTAQLLTSEISSAHLWFYIRKHDVPSLNVSIEKILPHSEPGRTFTTRKMYSLILGREKSMGWKRVNMKDSLREWIRHPMTNFGLLIKAVDSSGNNLIVLPSSSDVDKGYEPWLDTKIIEPRSNSRRRRSESLQCVENSTDTRCCRHPLLVGFAEFGWDWIIAPTHVQADYCTGECRLTMQDNTPYSWVNQQMPGTNSCCTPTKLSPLPLLYFDDSMNIVYQILQNMKVEKCGCA